MLATENLRFCYEVVMRWCGKYGHGFVKSICLIYREMKPRPLKLKTAHIAAMLVSSMGLSLS